LGGFFRLTHPEAQVSVKSERFELVLTTEERQKLAHLAEQAERSQGEVLRRLIQLASVRPDVTLTTGRRRNRHNMQGAEAQSCQ
jgi:hypothetical protein